MSNFKKVLKTAALFLLIVCILSIGIMEVFFDGENYYYQDAHERAELSGTLDFLICGSSHAMRALEPDILDEELGVNSYNLSFGSATLQGHYELLRVEMSRNPVDTVILCVSYNTMTRKRKDSGYEGDLYVLSKLDFWQRIPYFFSAIQPSEYISIYYSFLNRGFDCIDMMARGTWVNENNKIERGYVPYDPLRDEVDTSDALVTDYTDIYNTKFLSEDVDEQNVLYLDKILDLCNKNNVQLILINVPLSKTFISQCQNLDASREWYEAYAHLNDICYYDFNLYKENDSIFTDEEDFYDVYHMNNMGANQFSKLFSSFYNEMEGGEDVEDLFYHSYEELKSVIFAD